MSFAAVLMFVLFFFWSTVGMPIGHAMLVVGLRLSVPDRPGHRAGRLAEPERAVQQLRADGGAAVHPVGRHHERQQDHRPALSIRQSPGRPPARRARARQRRRQHHLLRHERQRARRRGRPRQAGGRHDGEGRLFAGLLGGAQHDLGHHRPDHPALDPDGALRPRLQHLHRLPLHGRRDSRAAARPRPDGRHRGHREEAQLSDRARPDPPGSHPHHRHGGARAAAAGHHARRHLLRRGDPDGGRRGGRRLCAAARPRLVSVAQSPRPRERTHRVPRARPASSPSPSPAPSS